VRKLLFRVVRGWWCHKKFMVVMVRFYVSLVMNNCVVSSVVGVCHVKTYWFLDCIISFDSFGLYYVHVYIFSDS